MQLFHDSTQEKAPTIDKPSFHLSFSQGIWEFRDMRVCSQRFCRCRSNSSMKMTQGDHVRIPIRTAPSKNTPNASTSHLFTKSTKTTHLFTCITAKMKNNPKPDRKKNSKESGRFCIFPSFNSKKGAFAFNFFLFFFWIFSTSVYLFFTFKAKPKDLNMFAPLPLAHVLTSWSCIKNHMSRV